MCHALASIGDPAQHHFDAVIGHENLPITALRGEAVREYGISAVRPSTGSG